MRPRDPRFQDASGSFDMDGFTMLGPRRCKDPKASAYNIELKGMIYRNLN